MARNNVTVPYGFEPSEKTQRGTLIYYDSFEETTDEELVLAADISEKRSFEKLVLYPLHEETMRRVTKRPISPFYKREDRLHEWKRERGAETVVVEGWEGKRKKYTPIDTALRYLSEKYARPLLLYVTPETANLFASFSSFEDWIVKIRLMLASEPQNLHPKLVEYRHRLDIVND